MAGTGRKAVLQHGRGFHAALAGACAYETPRPACPLATAELAGQATPCRFHPVFCHDYKGIEEAAAGKPIREILGGSSALLFAVVARRPLGVPGREKIVEKPIGLFL